MSYQSCEQPGWKVRTIRTDCSTRWTSRNPWESLKDTSMWSSQHSSAPIASYRNTSSAEESLALKPTGTTDRISKHPAMERGEIRDETTGGTHRQGGRRKAAARRRLAAARREV